MPEIVFDIDCEELGKKDAQQYINNNGARPLWKYVKQYYKKHAADIYPYFDRDEISRKRVKKDYNKAIRYIPNIARGGRDVGAKGSIIKEALMELCQNEEFLSEERQNAMASRMFGTNDPVEIEDLVYGAFGDNCMMDYLSSCPMELAKALNRDR